MEGDISIDRMPSDMLLAGEDEIDRTPPKTQAARRERQLDRFMFHVVIA